MPTKKPRGAELTVEQQRANQALHQRRLRIEHVNSSVKRCRMVKDRIRLWKEGVRDLVMDICGALPHISQTLHPNTAPTVKLRKHHEILNNSQHMPLVSLLAP